MRQLDEEELTAHAKDAVVDEMNAAAAPAEYIADGGLLGTTGLYGTKSSGIVAALWDDWK